MKTYEHLIILTIKGKKANYFLQPRKKRTFSPIQLRKQSREMGLLVPRCENKIKLRNNIPRKSRAADVAPWSRCGPNAFPREFIVLIF